MTKREAQALLERRLRPDFPQYQVHGDMLFRLMDRGRLLTGLFLERSQSDKQTVRLRAFVQPLVVPDDTVTFGIGTDLGSYQVNDDTAVQRLAEAAKGARPFLEQLASVRAVTAMSGEFDAALDADRAREVRAYGLVYEGDLVPAERDLGYLADLSSSEKPSKQLIAERARRAGAALAESESTAVGLLDRWASETRDALGLN